MPQLEIITDSSCSLPVNLLANFNIKQAPIKFEIDTKRFIDPCDHNKTLNLFKSGKLSRKHKVDTQAPSQEDFEKLIFEAVEQGTQTIIIQTVNRNQGDTYNNANMAVTAVQNKLGHDKSKYTIRVMDSRTVFAGQALMVAETIRMNQSEQNSRQVKRYMDQLSEHIQTYLIPREPLLAHERSKNRNDKSVNKSQVLIAKALNVYPIVCNTNDSSHLSAKVMGFKKATKQLFNHAISQIEKGLFCPLLAISYAGPLEELKKMDGFAELEAKAQASQIKLLISVMSIAGGIYISVGSISLAFASTESDWQG